MTTDSNNDSSSSDDENIKEALKEATDPQFLQNSLFNKNISNSKLIKPEKCQDVQLMKSSLRLNFEQIDGFENFGVSQSYKNFVAKKLYEYFERNIELTDVMNIKKIKKKKKSGSVRLLSSSVDTLNCQNEMTNNTLPLKRKIICEDSAENLLKCQEVAISPELIFAKTEIKSWNEPQKGVIYKYKKMIDGTLISE